MSFFSNLIVPLVLCMVFLGALVQRVDLLSAFARGVREGLQVVLDMFPSLMLLTLAVSVFQSSGALELLSRALSAPASLLGLPEPIIPLTLLRPLSGSGALVVFQNILSQFGPDSQAGEIASVLIGSTETTFYTIALYCSAAGIKKSRYAGHQKKPLRRARLAVRRPDGLCRQRGGGAVADGVEKSGSRNRDQAGNWNQFPA